MTTKKRDYSKLRPFDLEAFKAGKTALFIVGSDTPEVRTYAAGPDKDGRLCVSNQYGAFQFTFSAIEDYYMAPLAWVRKSADDETLWPVYKGDVLYDPYVGSRVAVGVEGERLRLSMTDGEPWGLFSPNRLTFTQPKVKRHVKLLAYLDADQLFWLRETAQPKWPAVRVPLEDRVVEVEEPAGQEGGPQ